MKLPVLFGDFETRSRIDIMSAGADVYARDRFTQVMAFGWAFDDEDVVVNKLRAPPPPRVIEHIARGGLMVAHDAPFEWVIWNHCWKKEFPNLPELRIEQLVCTMAMAYAMAIPGSLEKASAAAGTQMQKDMEGQRVMLQLATPKSFNDGVPVFFEPHEVPEKFERMYTYCGSDILVERLLYKRCAKISHKEQRIWQLDHKINQRGVQVDLESIEVASQLVEMEQERLDKEMSKATHGVVMSCTTNKQLTDWLIYRGVKNVSGVAKDDVADMLADPDLPEDCRRALTIRKEAAKSSTAKLIAMKFGACEDGRMRGLFQYHGAGTGRWAGRRVQLQNLPRPHINQNQIEEVFDILRRAGG